MNILVLFCEAAGPRGQESHLPKTRFHAGRQWATGLWFALALVASGLGFSSAARAQDDSWQDPPRRKPRAVVPSYPDDELPNRTVAMNEDAPPLPARVSPELIDSPSNLPSKRKKAEPAAEAIPDGEPQPARAATPARRRPVAVDEANALGPDETFGNSDEGSDESDFGYRGPGMRGILSHRLWFRGESLLWWVRGGQTPPLLTTSPASTPQAQAGVLGEADTTFSSATRN